MVSVPPGIEEGKLFRIQGVFWLRVLFWAVRVVPIEGEIEHKCLLIGLGKVYIINAIKNGNF